MVAARTEVAGPHPRACLALLAARGYCRGRLCRHLRDGRCLHSGRAGSASAGSQLRLGPRRDSSLSSACAAGVCQPVIDWRYITSGVASTELVKAARVVNAETEAAAAAAAARKKESRRLRERRQQALPAAAPDDDNEGEVQPQQQLGDDSSSDGELQAGDAGGDEAEEVMMELPSIRLGDGPRLGNPPGVAVPLVPAV